VEDGGCRACTGPAHRTAHTTPKSSIHMVPTALSLRTLSTVTVAPPPSDKVPMDNGAMSHLHKGFTSVSPGFAEISEGFAAVSRRFRGRFAGVSRAFGGRLAGVWRAFRSIRKPTNRFTWFSNPSLATQSFAKFTSLSHVSLHFRSVSQGNFTKFRSRFTAVSHAFARFHNVSLVKRCDGVT